MTNVLQTETNLDTDFEANPIPVIEEIIRGRNYTKLVREIHSCPKTIPKPIYKSEIATSPEFFVEKVVFPYRPKYQSCCHIKRNIINRDNLRIKEHIKLLATPIQRNSGDAKKPYVVKRKIYHPSHRVIELARPKPLKTIATCYRYAATMDQFCIENCYGNIRDTTFLNVNQAAYVFQMNKHKQILEKKKLKIEMQRSKRNQKKTQMDALTAMVEKVYLTNYKAYFLSPNKEKVKDEYVQRLSDFLLTTLSKMFDENDAPKRAPERLQEILIQISYKAAVLMKLLLDEIRPTAVKRSDDAGDDEEVKEPMKNESEAQDVEVVKAEEDVGQDAESTDIEKEKA